jgi:hypothetical protein
MLMKRQPNSMLSGDIEKRQKTDQGYTKFSEEFRPILNLILPNLTPSQVLNAINIKWSMLSDEIKNQIEKMQMTGGVKAFLNSN